MPFYTAFPSSFVSINADTGVVTLDGVEVAEELDEVEYYHFMFDQHEVVFSNGAASESLFTGPEAFKAIGRAAREEIRTLFPALFEENADLVPAGVLASGRMGRRLAVRHQRNGKALVQ